MNKKKGVKGAREGERDWRGGRRGRGRGREMDGYIIENEWMNE